MKKIKRLMDILPLMLLWLMLSAFLWSKVFMGLTDAPAENKITLFIDARIPQDTALAVEMEKLKREGIEMVKVHPFTYAMMSGSTLSTADLYIVPQSHIEEYKDWFAPLPEEMLSLGDVITVGDTPSGLLIYDGQAGAAAQYITYGDLPGERYYLFFGIGSVHLTDGAAVAYAQQLLTIP